MHHRFSIAIFSEFDKIQVFAHRHEQFTSDKRNIQWIRAKMAYLVTWCVSLLVIIMCLYLYWTWRAHGKMIASSSKNVECTLSVQAWLEASVTSSEPSMRVIRLCHYTFFSKCRTQKHSEQYNDFLALYKGNTESVLDTIRTLWAHMQSSTPTALCIDDFLFTGSWTEMWVLKSRVPCYREQSFCNAFRDKETVVISWRSTYI